MEPKPATLGTNEAFNSRLDELIDMRHPLVRLGSLVDWPEIERAFAASFTSPRGRPALSARLRGS